MCFRIFKQFQLQPTGSVCAHAAAGGCLSCLHLAHELGDWVNTYTAIQAAFQGGSKAPVLSTEDDTFYCGDEDVATKDDTFYSRDEDVVL